MQGMPGWEVGPVRPTGPQTGFRGARRPFEEWELDQPIRELHEVTAYAELGAPAGLAVARASRALVRVSSTLPRTSTHSPNGYSFARSAR
jgi:hypothetical protein